MIGDRTNRCRDRRGERIGKLIVAQPPIEQVAQKVDGRRLLCRSARERMKRINRRRTCRGKMQVGEYERRLHRRPPRKRPENLERYAGTSSARVMTTSSRGTF